MLDYCESLAPNVWLPRFLREMSARPEHFRTVLTGSACEQWVNAELFAWLAAYLAGSGLTVLPELRKRDLVVLPVSGDSVGFDSTAEITPAAIIETKLVYNDYLPGKLREYIARLVSQVTSSARFTGEPQLRIGLIFSIYARRQPEESDRLTYTEFQERVQQSLSEVLSEAQHAWTFTSSACELTNIVDPSPQHVGDATFFAGCAAGFFEAERIADESDHGDC